MFGRLADHRTQLALVLLAALMVRLVGAVWWQSRLPPQARFAFGDSESYWVLGQTLARGGPYQFNSPDASVFRMPGYPLLLAGLFRLVGHDPQVLWARGLSAVLGTGAVAAVYWLARQRFDRTPALVAAGLAALYPGAVGMSVFVLSEAPFCPLMLAQLAVWTASWQSTSPRRAAWLAALAGALAGATTLMRPGWLLFVPFGLLLAMVFGCRRARHLALGLVMMAGLIAAMAPWWIRNALVVGRFVPTTLQAGASLYDGLNPQADGSSRMGFVPHFEALENQAPAGQADPYEYRLDRRMLHAAFDWSIEHLRRVAELAAIKFVRMWNVWPNEPEHRGWLLRLVTITTYLPALALGIFGAWRCRRGGWTTALCCLPAVYLTLLHLVFVSSIRYREPAMLALLVLAAGAITKGCSPSSKA